MSTAFTHASLHWLLQLGASFAALLLGALPWTGWPLLAAFLVLLGASCELLARETRGRRRVGLGAFALAQAPGIALGAYVVACVAGLMDEPFRSMTLLQFWTAIFGPLIALLPEVPIAGRGAYVWLTLLLPFAQLGLAAAVFASAVRRGRAGCPGEGRKLL